MKSYAVARTTDGTITKGEIYPITLMVDGMVHISVNGKNIIVPSNDTDFTFYINCEDDFTVPTRPFLLIYEDIGGQTHAIWCSNENHLKNIVKDVVSACGYVITAAEVSSFRNIDL